jgi:hypothetical protein
MAQFTTIFAKTTTKIANFLTNFAKTIFLQIYSNFALNSKFETEINIRAWAILLCEYSNNTWSLIQILYEVRGFARFNIKI